MQAILKIIRKQARYRRHAASLLRYSSPGKLLNLARVEWQRLRKKELVTGLPYVVVLDPTNVCNLKCPICPTTRGELQQPNGRIDIDLFKRFIDQIAPHTYRLILYNWGEPFLHRQIVEMISHAHRGRISTSISSNLNVLPREGARALVQSGLDDLIVSCDGITQQSYEKYRVRGQLDRLLDHMNAIARAKKDLGRSNPHIEFQFLVFGHNEHEVPDVESFARQHGANTVRLVRPAIDLDYPEILPASDPNWVRPEIQALLVPAPQPLSAPAAQEMTRTDSAALQPGQRSKHAPLDAIDCFWPWRAITVSWNGEIDPCCYNNQLGSFGNVFKAPLSEIFNNKQFTYARRRIVGRADPDGFDNIICKTCKGYTV